MSQQPAQFPGNNDLNFNTHLLLEKQAKLLAQAQARAKADLIAAKGRLVCILLLFVKNDF